VKQETRRMLAGVAGDMETASWGSRRQGDRQLGEQETKRMLAGEAGDKANASQLAEQETR
jgi:hypothetical protein